MTGPMAAAFPDSLQELLLYGNSLTSISPAWRPPPHLHTLQLTYSELNQTVGQQQGWVAEAGKLQVLSLAHDKLHGSLPADLALPASLTTLDLSHNQLSGEGRRQPASSSAHPSHFSCLPATKSRSVAVRPQAPEQFPAMPTNALQARWRPSACPTLFSPWTRAVPTVCLPPLPAAACCCMQARCSLHTCCAPVSSGNKHQCIGASLRWHA